MKITLKDGSIIEAEEGKLIVTVSYDLPQEENAINDDVIE